MNVMWVDLVSELGGAQRSLLEVCGALPSLGVNVTAAVPYGPLFDQLKSAGITVYPISALRAQKHGWGLFVTTAKLLRAPSTIGQIIRTVKPDIVHTNNLPAFLAANRASSHIPFFWHVRDLAMPALMVHEASRKAERIIAASEAIDEHLVDVLSPRLLGHVRVICNGIDPERFTRVSREEARKKFGLPHDAPVVGMIAHMIPWKRHDAFIAAAELIRRQRPEARFVIVGRDLFGEHARYIAKLQEQAEKAGLKDCLAWIRDLDAPEELLPAFDVLLHPALKEPFGRIICEAMAARVPVVAAESAGPATIIEQRKSGVLVRDGVPQQMAEEALKLLADPALAARLAEEGLRTVRSKFTVRRVCEQLVKEYAAVMADHRAAQSKDDN